MGSESPCERAILREEAAVYCKVYGLPSMCGGDAAFLSNYVDRLLSYRIVAFEASEPWAIRPSGHDVTVTLAGRHDRGETTDG